MARRTILICDNCGNDVGENKGATLRVTFTDARRGSKVGRSLRRLRGEDARPRRCAPRPPAEVGRRRLTTPRGRRRARRRGAGLRPRRRVRSERRSRRPPVPPSRAGLRWPDGPEPACRARERGQGCAPARALSRAPRRRAVSDRAQPGDVDRVERDLLRRCGCLLGGSIGTFDDLFARIAAGDRDGARSRRDAQRTLIARRAVGLALGDGGTPLRARRASPASPTRC